MTEGQFRRYLQEVARHNTLDPNFEETRCFVPLSIAGYRCMSLAWDGRQPSYGYWHVIRQETDAFYFGMEAIWEFEDDVGCSFFDDLSLEVLLTDAGNE